MTSRLPIGQRVRGCLADAAVMPTGTAFHGFIPPFPIRVDEFGPTPGCTTVPALHLLSHTHSDHILGLSAKSFASTIICSADAKEMLLKHEVYNERALRDMDLPNEARLSRTFGHLRVPPLLSGGRCDYTGSRDLLVCRRARSWIKLLAYYMP